jgi:HlyD family secretion protein
MRGNKRIPVLLGMVLVSLLSGCSEGIDGGIQASGTVEATEADLGFQMAGRLESVLVREGDSVEAGAEVAFLDQEELTARRRSAEAQKQAAQALLDEMVSGFRKEEIGEGRAALKQAEELRDDALRDQERARRLFDGGSISREMLDKAQTAFRVAEAGVDQAQQRLQILEDGVRPERLAAQRANVAQADAAVAQVDAALRNSVVVVPFAGIVTVRHREPGETISPGLPVLTLLDPEDRWVRIYVTEDRIGAVNLGQTADIFSDTYPDRSYGGEVIFISSEAEFTPRNVQTTEERVKLVYAVKVRITGDPSHDLKAGIPADVVLSGSELSGD